MLLGFVLLGRSLEEGARIKASSDMNELLVSRISYISFIKIVNGMLTSVFFCKLLLGWSWHMDFAIMFVLEIYIQVHFILL